MISTDNDSIQKRCSTCIHWRPESSARLHGHCADPETQTSKMNKTVRNNVCDGWRHWDGDLSTCAQRPVTPIDLGTGTCSTCKFWDTSHAEYNGCPCLRLTEASSSGRSHLFQGTYTCREWQSRVDSEKDTPKSPKSPKSPKCETCGAKSGLVILSADDGVTEHIACYKCAPQIRKDLSSGTWALSEGADSEREPCETCEHWESRVSVSKEDLLADKMAPALQDFLANPEEKPLSDKVVMDSSASLVVSEDRICSTCEHWERDAWAVKSGRDGTCGLMGAFSGAGHSCDGWSSKKGTKEISEDRAIKPPETENICSTCRFWKEGKIARGGYCDKRALVFEGSHSCDEWELKKKRLPKDSPKEPKLPVREDRYCPIAEGHRTCGPSCAWYDNKAQACGVLTALAEIL